MPLTRLALALSAALALTACGADGPPVPPTYGETPALQFGATVHLSDIGKN